MLRSDAAKEIETQRAHKGLTTCDGGVPLLLKAELRTPDRLGGSGRRLANFGGCGQPIRVPQQGHERRTAPRISAIDKPFERRRRQRWFACPGSGYRRRRRGGGGSGGASGGSRFLWWGGRCRGSDSRHGGCGGGRGGSGDHGGNGGACVQGKGKMECTLRGWRGGGEGSEEMPRLSQPVGRLPQQGKWPLVGCLCM